MQGSMAQTTLIGRTRSEVTVLGGGTETVCSKEQLLQKLYAELDEEREASATAAMEAMDMILRLQGEKAMVEMEASQFKRMTEEMIDHAEATFEAYEELMYDKEMETESLKFQLQAYKNKLISLGCDLNASEFQYVRSNTSDQSSSIKAMRRLKSFPSTPIKKIMTLGENDAQRTETSPSPAPDSSHQQPSFVSGNGTIDSYWNKIKMLHAQARLISDSNNVGPNLKSRGGRSCSILSKASGNITSECGQTHRLNSSNSTEVVNHSDLPRDSERPANRPCSTNVHDVFEVPQASTVKHEIKRRHEKWNYLADLILTKPEYVSQGMIESPFKHDADKQKGSVTVFGQKKERMSEDCNSQTEVLQKIARLQRQKTSRRNQEITSGLELGDNEEQLRLLREIKSELKLIQSEMRSLKTKNDTPVDDAVSFGLLEEAMMHFWI